MTQYDLAPSIRWSRRDKSYVRTHQSSSFNIEATDRSRDRTGSRPTASVEQESGIPKAIGVAATIAKSDLQNYFLHSLLRPRRFGHHQDLTKSV